MSFVINGVNCPLYVHACAVTLHSYISVYYKKKKTIYPNQVEVIWTFLQKEIL